jgi:predicted nucleic acid-binding protein
MILVDTSAWIDFFRGSGPLCQRVDDLLEANEVALCGPVIAELRRGLRSQAERKKVLPLLTGCRLLAQPAELWEDAGDLGYLLARKGIAVKTLDLLITTYALDHGVALLSGDADFRTIRNSGVPIQLDVL